MTCRSTSTDTERPTIPYIPTKPLTKQRLVFADKRSSRTSDFTNVLGTILTSNPPRPSDIRDKTPEQIKHERDVRTLRSLLTHLPLHTLENFVTRLPEFVSDDIFYFWEGFHGMWDSVCIHIYQPELRAALSQLHDTWQQTLSFSHAYAGGKGELGYRFNWRAGIKGVNRSEVEAEWNAIVDAAKALYRSLQAFIPTFRTYHDDYPRISSRAKSGGPAAPMKMRRARQGEGWLCRPTAGNRLPNQPG